jgi:hypothetical protein
MGAGGTELRGNEGLRRFTLETRARKPVQALVIDHVEMPSAN